ncbi:MAG: glycosyltransferase [Chloroflexi bacterium]|nr:MAG: glycosyltransferase [Chloroflexota bacterium]
MIASEGPASRLRVEFPEMSAHRTLSGGQRLIAFLLAALLVAGLRLELALTLTLLLALATAVYLVNLGFRLLFLISGLRGAPLVVVADEDARSIPDRVLPVYTVLVPAYHEASVIGHTLQALERLDYPRERLDVKLLLEADDQETIAAATAAAARTSLAIEIARVPVSLPRTKPKACNVGLAHAKGSLVTIFDVEDRPEPLQLRRAALAFRRLPPSVACLQAKLSYHNARQNIITRWFTAEYETWFTLLLPALARHGGPVPLGGTSMHIKRDILERVGGWDPYNVTEDADLGVRLQRFRYQVMVLDSTTLEESNSDFVNWVKQRSRWYKGYLQTWLVHMRHPRRLWRELGPAGFLGLSVMVGAVPILQIINPLFWGLTVLWFVDRNPFLQSLLPPAIYFPALLSLVLGNFLALYMGLIAIRVARRPYLLVAALLAPAYWVMMSIAAVRALLQLVIAPSFWEKSVHGLDVHAPVAEGAHATR